MRDDLPGAPGDAPLSLGVMPMPDTPRERNVELASQERLARVEHLAPRFFREVLGWEYDEVLVTDESDLRDFADATAPQHERMAEIETFFARMNEEYFVDGRSAGSTRIVDLLELLRAHGVME